MKLTTLPRTQNVFVTPSLNKTTLASLTPLNTKHPFPGELNIKNGETIYILKSFNVYNRHKINGIPTTHACPRTHTRAHIKIHVNISRKNKSILISNATNVNVIQSHRPRLSVSSVSYTHLDVYKRQLI